MADPLHVTPRIVLPADELRWSAVRASGPGGQNVNKVSSKVELTFDVNATAVLDAATKTRLVALAGTRLDTRGVLHIVCQDTRDQRKNLELARERLAELVRAALIRPKTRRPTRPSRGARERRLDDKRRESDKKRGRAAPRGGD